LVIRIGTCPHLPVALIGIRLHLRIAPAGTSPHLPVALIGACSRLPVISTGMCLWCLLDLCWSCFQIRWWVWPGSVLTYVHSQIFSAQISSVPWAVLLPWVDSTVWVMIPVPKVLSQSFLFRTLLLRWSLLRERRAAWSSPA